MPDELDAIVSGTDGDGAGSMVRTQVGGVTDDEDEGVVTIDTTNGAEMWSTGTTGPYLYDGRGDPELTTGTTVEMRIKYDVPGLTKIHMIRVCDDAGSYYQWHFRHNRIYERDGGNGVYIDMTKWRWVRIQFPANVLEHATLHIIDDNNISQAIEDNSPRTGLYRDSIEIGSDNSSASAGARSSIDFIRWSNAGAFDYSQQILPLIPETNPYVDVSDPAFDGVYADGVNDDRKPIQEAIDFCRNNLFMTTQTPPKPVPGSSLQKLVFPTGAYLITRGLDITDMSKAAGFIIDLQGSTLIGSLGGTSASKAMVDLTGTRFCKLSNGTLRGSATNKPDIGILVARDHEMTSASSHQFRALRIEGHFVLAGLYSFTSELLHCYDVHIDNQEEAQTNAWAYVENRLNSSSPLVVESLFHTIGSGVVSNVYHRFYGCSFASKSSEGVVYLLSSSAIVMNNCHFTSKGTEVIRGHGGGNGCEILNFSTDFHASNVPDYFVRYVGTSEYGGVHLAPAGPVRVNVAMVGLDGGVNNWVQLLRPQIEGSAVDATGTLPRKLITVVSGNPVIENAIIRSTNGSSVDLANAKTFSGSIHADRMSNVSLGPLFSGATAHALIVTKDRIVRYSPLVGASIGSGNTLTVDANEVKVTGTTLDTLLLNNVQDGEEIWLRGNGTVTVRHNGSGTGNIFLTAATNTVIGSTSGLRLKWRATGPSTGIWVED